MSADPTDQLLGQSSEYPTTYTPSLLRPIKRADQRQALGLDGDLPFGGEDVWMGYELSWLDLRGKPAVAGVRIRVPCNSGCIVESKSLKLYLNSFALTQFATPTEVLGTLNADLGLAFRGPVMVEMLDLNRLGNATDQFPGTCLDWLDVRTQVYERDPELLRLEQDDERVAKETVHTDLFRSVCPVTGQPDWASVMVAYVGAPIVRESLLAYLISFRTHAAFHETTVEQIYLDIMGCAQPDQLTVYGRFLRRGGLDISPFRSNVEDVAPLMRLARQ